MTAFTHSDLCVRDNCYEFARRLTSKGFRHIRINTRVNLGAPDFLVMFESGTNAAVFFGGIDLSESQLDYLEALDRGGWRVFATDKVDAAAKFVLGLTTKKVI